MPQYQKASTTKGLEYLSRRTVCVKRIKNKEDYIDLLLDVSPFIVAHHVVSAVESEDSEIFTGFCIESASGVMNSN